MQVAAIMVQAYLIVHNTHSTIEIHGSLRAIIGYIEVGTGNLPDPVTVGKAMDDEFIFIL